VEVGQVVGVRLELLLLLEGLLLPLLLLGFLQEVLLLLGQSFLKLFVSFVIHRRKSLQLGLWKW